MEVRRALGRRWFLRISMNREEKEMEIPTGE